LKFEWTEKCEKVFIHLKELLKIAPVIKIANPNAYFVVCTDAYKERSVGVLTHNGHMVFYDSIKLMGNERNYTMHDLELESIINVLKM